MNEPTYLSPAAKALREALDLDLEGRSPYPEVSRFIDADTPHTDRAILRAFEEGEAAVVVSADGSTRILHPDGAVREAG